MGGIRRADDQLIEHQVKREIGREASFDVLLQHARKI